MHVADFYCFTLLRFCYNSLFFFTSDVSARCPEGYEFFNGRCFVAHQTPLKFDEAETECNKQPGGYLASIRSTDLLGISERTLLMVSGTFHRVTIFCTWKKNLNSLNLEKPRDNLFQNQCHLKLISIKSTTKSTSNKWCDLAMHFRITQDWLWVGLSERQHKGTWMFTDGTALNDSLTVFQNGGRFENCAMLRYGSALDDHGCQQELGFICMASGKHTCP